MRSFVVLCALAAASGVVAVAALAAGGSAGEPARAAFRLPDGSAACAYADGQVACRSDGDRVGTVFTRDGSVHRSDVVVAWDETTPALLPAESWWHGGFTCRVRGERIACEST